MSRRYATTTNEQADLSENGQRDKFARDIPGRKGADEKLGKGSSSSFVDTLPEHDVIEQVFKNAMDAVGEDLNPDFRDGVDLNYGKAADDSKLLEGARTLKDFTDADDKPQYGAPNVRTGDMNDPTAVKAGINLPLREAGFGIREVGGDDVSKPAKTRERIGTYFNNHSRRTGPLGTSNPNKIET